jgi:hypothetical protein
LKDRESFLIQKESDLNYNNDRKIRNMRETMNIERREWKQREEAIELENKQFKQLEKTLK